MGPEPGFAKVTRDHPENQKKIAIGLLKAGADFPNPCLSGANSGLTSDHRPV
jgi:hypothetical protein